MSKKQSKPFQSRIVAHGEEAVDAILFNPANWRIHPKAQQDALEGVLSEVGWVQDVIVNRTTGHLVDGHLRCQVAARNGEKTVPVVYVELSEAEEALILASIDPIAAMAATDKAKLDALMAQVQSSDERVQAMMAEIAEKEGLEYGKKEQSTDEVPEPEIDKAAELQAKWNTALGQIWALGEHRLIIADCTDQNEVLRLMDGEKARVVVTSPPYSNQRDYEVGDFDWQALARGFSDCAFAILDNPGDVLINLGLEHKDGHINPYWNEWLDYCGTIGRPLYGWYIWDKGSGFPGEWNGRLAPAHEWVFHFSNGRKSANKWIETSGESAKRGAGGKRFRQKDGSLQELTSPDKIGQPFKVPDSVIRIGREMARGIHTQAHPAVFPLEFSAFIIQTWSDPGSIVYEPFSGSGTTICACDQTGRKCRACEIAPSYAAVSLERYLQMTSKTPELLNVS